MTRQKHDQFSKQYIAELLDPAGDVKINYEIQGESRYVDLYFTPTSAPSPNIGLLAQMGSEHCLLEPFRNQPSKVEIRDCMLKLFALHSELLRQAKRQNKSLGEDELPRLWILASAASDNLLNFFEAKLNQSHWGQGVYFLNQWTRTAIVAINRLPTTPETLWLRILGKGATQQQAIDEITSFPKENVLRNRVLELLFLWHIRIETNENLSTDDKELLMNLSPAYLRWREETLQQGRLEGIQQGLQQGRLEAQRVFVENWLVSRFGNIDKALVQVIEPLVHLPPEESSRLLLQLSRDELLTKFSKK